MRRTVITGAILASLAFGGCGASEKAQGASAADIARGLEAPGSFEQGGRARHVTCIKQSGRTFKCLGDFASDDYPTQRMTWNVTVSPDGTFIAEPS
jgi:hypothetical protein